MKKFIIPFIILLLGLWIACDREIPSDFDLDEFPEAPAPPTNLRIQVGDNVLDLSWEVGNASAIEKYFIYRTNNAQDTLALYDSSTTTGYADEGVQNGIRYLYQVSALSTQDVEGNRSAITSAVPGIFSLTINNDAEYTSSRDVSANPTAPDGTSHIMLSNSEDFASSKWLNYSNSVSWQLTDGDGEKTVYARFKDSEGNQTTESFSDNITLDTRAEIDTFYISGSETVFEPGDKMHFAMDAGETGGNATVEIADVATLNLFDNGSNGDAIAGNGIYEFDYIIPPNTEVLNSSVTASFTDRADNQAPQYILPDLIQIASPPEAPELSAVGSKEDQIELAWISSSIPDFKRYRIYRSESSTVDEGSELVTTITDQNAESYTDEELDPNTRYYYRLFIYDNSGLSAGSNTVNRTTSANVDPMPVSLAMEVRDSVTFRLTWTQNDDTDFESYRIYRSTSSGVSNSPENLLVIENSQGATTFTDDAVEFGNTYYYKVYVFDRFGASAGSNEVFAPK
jgi:fibronectin type 3 domain-containing protein